jgi:molybdopterin converting factor small subunit
MLNIRIHLFGAFRNFSKYFENKDKIELQFDSSCTVAELRIAFEKVLQAHCPDFNELLLKQSVFANENNILSEAEILEKSLELVILPPISGG